VNKLTIAPAFDQSGRSEDPQVVGDGPGRDTLKSDEFAAIQSFPRRDGLQDSQAGLVRQGFGDCLNLRPLHASFYFIQMRWSPDSGAPVLRCVTFYFDAHQNVMAG
jgi:hypothetical protein